MYIVAWRNDPRSEWRSYVECDRAHAFESYNDLLESNLFGYKQIAIFKQIEWRGQDDWKPWDATKPVRLHDEFDYDAAGYPLPRSVAQAFDAFAGDASNF